MAFWFGLVVYWWALWFVLVMLSGLEVALDFYDEVLVLAWSNLVSLRVWARWASP